jgi:hypothetical protein
MDRKQQAAGVPWGMVAALGVVTVCAAGARLFEQPEPLPPVEAPPRPAAVVAAKPIVLHSVEGFEETHSPASSEAGPTRLPAEAFDAPVALETQLPAGSGDALRR